MAIAKSKQECMEGVLLSPSFSGTLFCAIGREVGGPWQEGGLLCSTVFTGQLRVLGCQHVQSGTRPEKRLRLSVVTKVTRGFLQSQS